MLDLHKIGDSPDLPRVDSEKDFYGGEVSVGTSTAESSFLGKSGEIGNGQFLRKSSLTDIIK